MEGCIIQVDNLEEVMNLINFIDYISKCLIMDLFHRNRIKELIFKWMDIMMDLYYKLMIQEEEVLFTQLQLNNLHLQYKNHMFDIFL